MRNIEISDKLKYIQNLFAKEDELLKKADMASKKSALPINIGAEEGKLLQVLMSLINAEKIVEIGTLTAYSTIWLARSLKDYKIDSGKVYSFEKDKKHYDIAKEVIKNSDVENKIEIIFGDAVTSLSQIENESPFDAIFIDADKIGYCKYLDWAEKNIKKGGLIIGDNSLLFGAVYQDNLQKGISNLAKKTMLEFNKRLADETKYKSILLPTQEGMTVAVKQF